MAVYKAEGQDKDQGSSDGHARRGRLSPREDWSRGRRGRARVIGEGFLKRQTSKGVQALPLSNHFSLLPVEEYADNEISLSETQPSTPKNDPPTPTPTRIHFSGTRWQWKHIRALTTQPILVARTDRSSLEVDTGLEATSLGHRHQVRALIDSGAKFQFLDINFVRDNAIPSIALPQSIPVYNVDGMENQAGAITHVVDASLSLRNHSEHTLFVVTNLGDQQMLLGHDWLVNHNPEIDWVRGEVKFTRCHSHCSECSKQRLAEHSALCT